MPDPAPDKICQFLDQEGYDVNNICFEKVISRIGYLPDVYRSSKPVRYENRITDLWEVRCMANGIKVYYVIKPYYGEVPQ